MINSSTPKKTSAATPTAPQSKGGAPPLKLSPLFFFAWLLCALFYLFQYAVRSAPGVMQAELTTAWGGNHIGAMISAYYVAYAFMALVAGVLLDRYGPRSTIPYGIAVVGIGCLIFAQGGETAGMVGFVIQGIGAIFGFIGASYVAASYLPASMLAMFLGFTQCLGMVGAAFGTKPVSMLIDPKGSFHVGWQHVWIAFGIAGFVLAILTWIMMPREKGDSPALHASLSIDALIKPFKLVLANGQSWLAGIIGGLLFLPTTIGALVWATSFLHAGEKLTMAQAAADAAAVPLGWVIGCPLLGWLSDKMGLRKPVLIGGALVILAAGLLVIYVPMDTVPRYAVNLLLGIASGAAMIPFSMMKEANLPAVKGTAAGVMNFLVFGTTGVMSPFISRLMAPTGGTPLTLHEFQDAFLPLVGGVIIAIILSFFIRETGSDRAKPTAVVTPAPIRPIAVATHRT